MLDYVVQVTEDATRCTRDDIETLHQHGFDDRAILQITLIASWFNYINRVADALGVGRDDPVTGETLSIPDAAPWK
jgi:alkylhydroperoxidase family enzyme